MAEPNPRHENLANVIFDMEGDLRDVKSWAEVLLSLSATGCSIEPAALSAVGRALENLGDALEEQFSRAFALSRRPT